MPAIRTTLAQFLRGQRGQETADEFDALVLNIARSCRQIAERLAAGKWGAEETGGRTLRVRGRYLTVFTPLGGAEPAEPAGSIFSVLPALASGTPGDHLPGSEQLCAGCVSYGAATVLMLTTGDGVSAFTLDPSAGEFVLTRSMIRLPTPSNVISVVTSDRHPSDPAVRRYVDECRDGACGSRGRDFTLHSTTSLAAGAHRLLTEGGVLLCPPRPHLVFEANPVALLVEQAGGLASTGRRRVLDVAPAGADQRTGLAVGAPEEVRRIEAYHGELTPGGPRRTGTGLEIPFFSSRGLFRVGG
ncbi:MAG TPA: hypothetical protein VFE65_10770 [Pseudonocardia sp.]|jgi:fructose-1,6-bisphosphatase I/sedoheptulose-1,7-bisphosphatase|nr:hypothetical protein [Pseudonocardia sp.]